MDAIRDGLERLDHEGIGIARIGGKDLIKLFGEQFGRAFSFAEYIAIHLCSATDRTSDTDQFLVFEDRFWKISVERIERLCDRCHLARAWQDARDVLRKRGKRTEWEARCCLKLSFGECGKFGRTTADID